MFIKVEDNDGNEVFIEASSITGFADLGKTRVIYFHGFVGGLGVKDSVGYIAKEIQEKT